MENATPQLAATVVLVHDDPFEVLMVRRHAKAVFASALVFPGGVVDPEDYDEAWLQLIETCAELTVSERALRIAGIRETWEETSLLIARDVDGRDVAQPLATDAPFIEVVRASGGRLMLDELYSFSHWVTPEVAPRRFDTRFFLAKAPDGQRAVADGGENVWLEWVSPADAVARALDGDESIIFPTLMNLSRLAASTVVTEAIAAARDLPLVTVLPRIEVRDDGSRVIVIPEDAGYEMTEYKAP